METKSKLMVIQGPNINMLGTRETDVYGSMKMEDIHGQMTLSQPSGFRSSRCISATSTAAKNFAKKAS